MKIKIREIVEGCMPKIINKGDWIDLYTTNDIELMEPTYSSKTKKFIWDYTCIPLGVAMELPKGFEAIIVPRSSTFKRHLIMQTNGMGIVDFSFSGNDDEWKMPVIAFNNSYIEKGTRLCQFKIQLSQKATFWQKLKWLFCSKIEFIKVDNLSTKNRNGFGSTGI